MCVAERRGKMVALKKLVTITILISIYFNCNDIQALYPCSTGISLMEEIINPIEIDVGLRVLKRTGSYWEFELTIQNKADHSVYVMINPSRADDSNGHFITLDKKDSSILEISSHVYPLPPYFLITNSTSVELKQMAPMTSYTEAIIVKLPMQESMPPYGDTPKRISIDANNIKQVRAAIGILPDEDGVRDLLKRKPMGPFVNGREEMMKGSFKGKRLIDLQTVIYSEMLKL
jgi:hypothetical protein